MKSAFALLMLLVSLTLPAREARACSCLSVSLERQLEFAAYAFAGTVVDVDTIRSNESFSAFLVATIAVDRVWKGQVTREFEVWTRSSSASCGYNDPWARFEIGVKFLLYAFEPSADVGHVYTHLCTRNAKYDDAREDLKRLGPGSRPVKIEDVQPPGFLLQGPHPHPAVSRTGLMLSVDRAQHLRVDVFNLLGRRVATLHDGPVPEADRQRLEFDAESLPSGVYLVRATGDTSSQVQAVLVMR